MTIIPVTLATAGLLGLIYIALSLRVVFFRVSTRVNIGDGGGDPKYAPLQVAMRSHANFSEYVPLALILLGGIELSGGAHTLLVILAIMLIAGRVAHPFGMMRPAPNPFRAGGAVLTWLVIIMASIEALILAL